MYDSDYGYIQNFIDYFMQIFYMIMEFLGLMEKKEEETTAPQA